MGEENKPSVVCYSLNGETGEMKELGKISSISESEEIKPSEIENIDYANLGEEFNGEATFTIIPRTITKKRFIKLLMGCGYQKNEAIRMHQEYMSTHKVRTKIGLIMFEIFYSTDESEIELELRIGGSENVNCKSE